jgi:POT family proton-dependent oligopeptide transporter
MGKRGIEPSAPLKFAFGLIQVGLGFIVLVYGAGRDGELTPMIFIILLYLLHSTAELCFSPVGLSSMTRLAVGSITGLMMGTWFLATAAGNFIAAQIAKLTEGADADHILIVYARIGWVVIAIGLAAIPLSWLVRRLMHLDSLRDDNVGDDLLGQKEAGEPAAGGMHPEAKE